MNWMAVSRILTSSWRSVSDIECVWVRIVCCVQSEFSTNKISVMDFCTLSFSVTKLFFGRLANTFTISHTIKTCSQMCTFMCVCNNYTHTLLQASNNKITRTTLPLMVYLTTVPTSPASIYTYLNQK